MAREAPTVGRVMSASASEIRPVWMSPGMLYERLIQPLLAAAGDQFAPPSF